MIYRFFAVTLTSVYEVQGNPEEESSTATKVAVAGHSSVAVGEKLKYGRKIAVGEQLQAFTPKGMEGPEWVNTNRWGGHSSPIVALFADLDEAVACLAAPDLQPRDPRWLEKTREILALIGEGNPAIHITQSPTMALLPAV